MGRLCSQIFPACPYRSDINDNHHGLPAIREITDCLPASGPEIQFSLLLAQHQVLLKRNIVFVTPQIKIGIEISLKTAKNNLNQYILVCSRKVNLKGFHFNIIMQWFLSYVTSLLLR